MDVALPGRAVKRLDTTPPHPTPTATSSGTLQRSKVKNIEKMTAGEIFAVVFTDPENEGRAYLPSCPHLRC